MLGCAKDSTLILYAGPVDCKEVFVSTLAVFSGFVRTFSSLTFRNKEELRLNYSWPVPLGLMTAFQWMTLKTVDAPWQCKGKTNVYSQNTEAIWSSFLKNLRPKLIFQVLMGLMRCTDSSSLVCHVTLFSTVCLQEGTCQDAHGDEEAARPWHKPLLVGKVVCF